MCVGVEALNVAKEFYALQALKSLVGEKVKFGIKSQEKLYEDILSFASTYEQNLADALFDYTVKVLYSEMRHGKTACFAYNVTVPQGGKRNESYQNAIKFNPMSILIASSDNFNNYYWSSSFGGNKWGFIADRVLLKGKILNVVFCDMCFSLTHNSAPYLNKSQANIFTVNHPQDYIEFLDFKFDSVSLEGLLIKVLIHCGERFKKLVKRAKTLGFLNKITMSNFTSDGEENAEYYIYNYVKIVWGNEWMSKKTMETSNFEGRQVDKLENLEGRLKFKKGAKVKILKVEDSFQSRLIGFVGVVAGYSNANEIGVVFEERVEGGLSLNDTCGYGCGLYFTSNMIEKTKEEITIPKLFKIGDIVKVINKNNCNRGKEGVIKKINNSTYSVFLNGIYSGNFGFAFYEIGLIEKATEKGVA